MKFIKIKQKACRFTATTKDRATPLTNRSCNKLPHNHCSSDLGRKCTDPNVRFWPISAGQELPRALVRSHANNWSSRMHIGGQFHAIAQHVLLPIRPAGWPPRRLLIYRPPGGRTMGQGLFGYFCGCLTKVPRRKGETYIPVRRECWICKRRASYCEF